MSPHSYKCNHRIRGKKKKKYQMFTVLSLGGRILGYSCYSLPIFYFIFLHFCNKHCAELWMVGIGDSKNINSCYIRKAFPLKIRLKENPNPESVRLPSVGVVFRVDSLDQQDGYHMGTY